MSTNFELLTPFLASRTMNLQTTATRRALEVLENIPPTAIRVCRLAFQPGVHHAYDDYHDTELTNSARDTVAAADDHHNHHEPHTSAAEAPSACLNAR